MINYKKINKNAKEPKYMTKGASGADLFSTESYILKPGERKLIGTGLAFEIPEGLEIIITPRSGLAYKHGITVLNSPGTIDSDYRGEIKVILINLSDKEYKINKGKSIAQMKIKEALQFNFNKVDVLNSTKREDNGFGHTG